MTPDELLARVLAVEDRVAFQGKVLVVLVSLKIIIWAVAAWLLVANQRLTVKNNQLLNLCKAYLEVGEAAKRQSRDQLLGAIGSTVKAAVDEAHPSGLNVVTPLVVVQSPPPGPPSPEKDGVP